MKHLAILGFLGGLFCFGCGSKKEVAAQHFPDNQAWELAYLGNNLPELNALFPERKPYLFFESDTGMVIGNSGCNGYSAPIEVTGSSLSFGTPGPSTLMYCGEGEGIFRALLQQVDQWKLTPDGLLQLLQGEVLLIGFQKIPNPE